MKLDIKPDPHVVSVSLTQPKLMEEVEIAINGRSPLSLAEWIASVEIRLQQLDQPIEGVKL